MLTRTTAFLLACTGCLSALSLSCEYDSSDQESARRLKPMNEQFQVFLVAGQSNTHYGLELDPDLDQANPLVFQLGRFQPNNAQVIQGVEPFDHHSKVENRIGFSLSFAKAYLREFDSSSDPILIIPCGAGGTGFISNEWNKGNPLYQDAVNRVRYVLKKYPQSELKAVLWHQGEKEANHRNEHFQEDLDNFIRDLRDDLGHDNLPFVLGGLVPYWVDQDVYRLTFQSILKTAPTRMPLVGYADPERPFVIEKADNAEDVVHFSAEGQREMGNRYFMAYKQIVDQRDSVIEYLNSGHN